MRDTTKAIMRANIAGKGIAGEVAELKKQLRPYGAAPRQGKEDFTAYRDRLVRELNAKSQRNKPTLLSTNDKTVHNTRRDTKPKAVDLQAELDACHTVYPDGTKIMTDPERFKRLRFLAKHTPVEKPLPNKTKERAAAMLAELAKAGKLGHGRTDHAAVNKIQSMLEREDA